MTDEQLAELAKKLYERGKKGTPLQLQAIYRTLVRVRNETKRAAERDYCFCTRELR